MIKNKRYIPAIIGIIIFATLTINLNGQLINVSDKLTLKKLTERTYIHTCQNNNGLVFINGDKALIVSTPDSDTETQNLIDWVTLEKKATIIGYVIDRWHPDAMEGLDVVLKNQIETYSFKLTQQIAKSKGLPVTKNGFDEKMVIKVGNDSVICHYLGESHTKDGIVVWVPNEKILFGGNGIRNYNGWIGNIADANLNDWSETAEKVKNNYGSANFVVPGHGKYGGVELIDYTIDLYRNINNAAVKNEFLKAPVLNDNKDFIIQAEKDSTNNEFTILTNAKVIVHDSTKYVEIESPLIKYQPDIKRIDSETGSVKIFDKTLEGGKIRTDVQYKKLILLKIDDSVGLRVILRGIEK
jgi:glyoxylase-like metal-dependent hydrolase (beta-lactamase superfamily II)